MSWKRDVFLILGIVGFIYWWSRPNETRETLTARSLPTESRTPTAKVDVVSTTERAETQREARVSESILPSAPAASEVVEAESEQEIERRRELCRLRNLNVRIPIEKGSLFWINSPHARMGDGTYTVAVKAPSCPRGKHSIVRYAPDGRLLSELSCVEAGWTELAALTGIQGPISESAPNPARLNLAIYGNGYFVLRCPKKQLRLTREGSFLRWPNGTFRDAEGKCTLLNTEGRSFRSEGHYDSVGLADPEFDNVVNLRYLNSHSFTASRVNQNKWPGGRPRIAENELESLNYERRGPEANFWEGEKPVDLDELSCEGL